MRDVGAKIYVKSVDIDKKMNIKKPEKQRLGIEDPRVHARREAD